MANNTEIEGFVQKLASFIRRGELGECVEEEAPPVKDNGIKVS